MRLVGLVVQELEKFPTAIAQIDTIDEGAGVYSRLLELSYGGIGCIVASILMQLRMNKISR